MTAVLSLNDNDYLYGAFVTSLKSYLPEIPIAKSVTSGKVFHYADYEDLVLDRAHDANYLMCSYVYRKALIRKHYLAHTVHSYVVKHRESILNRAFPETYQLEVDYAEFLDDALDESYELRQSIDGGQKWILKPSMSDKGQGIRIFQSIDELQSIFDSFEENDSDYEDDDDQETNGIITSQLRLFIVQKYISNPLILKPYGKKFHIRTYALCSGALKVYVYTRMLALFAATSYSSDSSDLNCHLTNTCLQTAETAELNNSVVEFAALEGLTELEKQKILDQILDIVKELFKAALNVDRINFQPVSSAFEFYGIDFLVDSEFKVSVLEVNAYPDFKQTGSELKSLVYELIDSTVKQTVAPFFGKTEKSNDKLIKVLDENVSY